MEAVDDCGPVGILRGGPMPAGPYIELRAADVDMQAASVDFTSVPPRIEDLPELERDRILDANRKLLVSEGLEFCTELDILAG
jgi:hypothetical protein